MCYCSEVSTCYDARGASTSPPAPTIHHSGTIMNVMRRLLQTESKWNPKVILGRALMGILPESSVNFIKKHYYSHLISHRPESWMEGDASVCDKFISPDDVVLDIGASIGSFTLFMAKRAAHVYAFEPIPQIYEFLQHNTRKHRNVSCLPWALSDRSDEKTMVVPRYKWGQECWYDACIKTPQSTPGLREFKVVSRTLDSFTLLPRIDFIKCDVNGHELEMLRGASNTIRRDHPAILMEVLEDPDSLTSWAFHVFEFMAREGYDAYIYNGHTLHVRRPGERSQNYFFLRAEHLSRVEELLPEMEKAASV